jgi:histidyl-tRNA synthetase
MKEMKKLSTESYKGVRDFYPEDMAIQNHIFGIWRKCVEKYGYEEYTASVLEPAELYKAKSGEEIVNEQTYTFIDRGEREVTLRPEMTPTVARMVAHKKRELAFPLRWYSIPNLFRYEQPQKGRLREHWQLNVDIFGVETLDAETEVIQIAYDITKASGLKDSDFEIRINNRKLMNYVTRDVLGLDSKSAHAISKLIDKKRKIDGNTFKEEITKITQDKAPIMLALLNSKNFEEFTNNLPQTKEEHEGASEIRSVIDMLEKLGITNAVFDQTLMRGFDYYTGIVFEIFDKNPENRRSLCGGGRYDDLLSLFGGEKVPAVGFGLGDVTARDVMETYKSLPKIHSSADYYIAVIDKAQAPFAKEVAQSLRNEGKKVILDSSYKKIGEQIKSANKRNINKLIVIGEEEVKTGKYKIKDLTTGETK